MEGVWHLNAPQWTDFGSSPQVPDESYFETVHEDLEPQPLREELIHKKVSENETSEIKKTESDMHLLEVPIKNDSLISETEIAKQTPVKIQVSPRSRNKKNVTTKCITYDNVLSEAMASLQLSVKKKPRRSHQVTNTVTNITATPTNADKSIVTKFLKPGNGSRSTPSNPIPMWIKKTIPSESRLDDKNEKSEHLEKNREAQKSTKQDDSALPIAVNMEKDNINKAAITDSEVPVDINEVNPGIKDPENKEQPELVEDSNNSKESVDTARGDVVLDLDVPQVRGHSKRGSNISQRSTRVNQARFSTCPLRRRSLSQYRRRSNKFISLAEAISKFQNKTPVRFRSVSSKNLKPGPVQMVRQSSVSATVPVSPALRCKTRTRPTTVLSQEERERVEIEAIRKNSVRENLARSNSLKTLTQGSVCKSNTKKPVNVVEPSVETNTSHQNLEKKANRESRMRVTVPTVVSTCEGIEVADAEISNFGVPDITSAKLTTTKVMPFSFETRNKELQKRKEKKIKELMTEEEKKRKFSFHARPVPAFKKPMLVATKETTAAKLKTKPCPFSFEQRDKNLIKKKEDFIKTVLEEDKKARIFQAKPIPEFKPVMVRGISKENINSGAKTQNTIPQQKTRVSMLPVSKSGSRSNLVSKPNVSNRENQNPSLKSSGKITREERAKSHEDKTETQQKTCMKVLSEFHLNTDKRAKERREFDERIKQKEQEIELLRKEAEVEKLKRDETERAEIRRMAETKARPMPAYKIPAVIHSDKPLTQPQSPGWSAKPNR